MKTMTRTQKALLRVFGCLVLLECLYAFFVGFHPPLRQEWAISFLRNGVGILSVVCFVATLVMCGVKRFRGGSFLKFILAWPCLVIVGLPTFCVVIAAVSGAIVRVKMVGPDDVVREGRHLLVADFKESSQEPFDLDKVEEVKRLASGIARLDPMGVWKHWRHVSIKMCGSPQFMGFVIVPEGNILPESPPGTMTWKITDGLYWVIYSAWDVKTPGTSPAWYPAYTSLDYEPMVAAVVNTTVSNYLFRLRADLVDLSKEHQILKGVEEAVIRDHPYKRRKDSVDQMLSFAKDARDGGYGRTLDSCNGIFIEAFVTDRFMKHEGNWQWWVNCHAHDIEVYYDVKVGQNWAKAEQPILDCVYRRLLELVNALKSVGCQGVAELKPAAPH